MPIHVLNATLAKQLQAAFLNFTFACTVQFTCTVHANSANSLALSRTVQVNFTVPVNSAIHLHCSGDFLLFFFFSVYSFCIFFF